MPVPTRDNFVCMLNEFVATQSALQDELLRTNATVKDWTYLTGLSRRGNLNAHGALWDYVRHGAGVRFESDDGIVVDVHNYVLEKDLVDAHRMSEFIVSKYKDLKGEVDFHNDCVDLLKYVEEIGIVERVREKENVFKVRL